jgi:imidazole glycerol-phosphate synthase subunit HisF
MHRKRILPCLDVRDGQVVKGVNFLGLQEMGEPAAHAKFYNDEGADELVILDITASHERRRSMIHVVESVADVLFIPLTVGGGIRTVEDVRDMLNAGADRVSVNTAAVKNPCLMSEAADRFGSQCVVVAIDAKWRPDASGWDVYIYGGRERTSLDAIAWAQESEKRGAGEILLTSMDRDGTQIGYDIPLLRAISSAVSIPVIASGGAGEMKHFAEALKEGCADAVLAASLFHTRTMSIGELKEYLRNEGIPIR